MIVGIYALIGIGRLDVSLMAGFAEAVIGWRKVESPVKTELYEVDTIFKGWRLLTRGVWLVEARKVKFAD